MQAFMDIPVGSQKLAACLHRPEAAPAGGAAPVVICCHGLTGSRAGACFRFVRLARRLAEEGVACLRFDFRGCGESDGRFVDVTVSTLMEDLLAARAAVQDLPGCDPTHVGIVGSSFGAFTASHAADRIAGLRCLAFWAPVADVRSLIQHQMPPPAWAFLREHGWVDHHGMPLGAPFFEHLPESDGPTQLARFARPLLIYHSLGDQQVQIEHGRAFETALRQAGVEVQFEPVEADDHSMRSVALNERIIEGTTAWLRRFLCTDED